MPGAGVEVPDAVHEALRSIAANEGLTRPRYHVELGSAVGDGYTSIVYRATLGDEDTAVKKKEMSVICKTTGFTDGKHAFTGRIFASEAHMYNTVLPKFAEIGHLNKPLPWGRCLYASVEGDSAPCLALSDLRPLGFAMASRKAPLDEKHCRLALQQLARFHGAGMALKHLRPDEFRAAHTTLGNPFTDNPIFKDIFATFLDGARDNPDLLLDRFPKGSEANTKLQGVFQNYADNFFDIVEPSDDVPGTAIVHGDCHPNNIMFQYDKETGAVIGCQLIDFQMCRHGCTAWDLGSLLFPSLDKATRDEHWDGLLRGYHNELQATLRNAGCTDPDAIYSWDQFQDRLRWASEYGVFFTPMLIQAYKADDKAAQELKDSMAEIDRMSDGNGEGKEPTPFKVSAETPGLKERFGDLVQDLLDWGWL